MSDALQAHMWPNMEMKPKPGQKESHGDDDDRTEQQAAAGGGLESLDIAAATSSGGGAVGREGEKGEEEEGVRGASREGLETKAAASLVEGKEEAKSKVGEL